MSEALLWSGAGCIAGAAGVLLWIMWRLRNLW